MKITTGLSKEHIKNIILQSLDEISKYEFKLKIDDKEYNADLIGFVIQQDPIIINHKITVKDMSFEDFEMLKFQSGGKYKIDNNDYYVSKIKADGFTQKVEFNFYSINNMLSTY